METLNAVKHKFTCCLCGCFYGESKVDDTHGICPICNSKEGTVEYTLMLLNQIRLKLDINMNYNARDLLNLEPSPDREKYLFERDNLLEIMRQNREERMLIDNEIARLSRLNPKDKIYYLKT